MKREKEIKIMASVALSLVLMTGAIVTSATAQTNETSSEETQGATVVRDSTFAMLSGQELSAKDFIHLYDTTPYFIANGHVAAKIPCDNDTNSTANILIGQAPNLKAAELEFIPELSKPGELCLYHADLESSTDSPVTDVAIQNPGDETITFPPTSTVVIGINKIMAGAETSEHHMEEGSTTETTSTSTDNATSNADTQ